jgi:hypothetical protein
MSSHEPYELIEIVIHKGDENDEPSIPSEEERIAMWKKINEKESEWRTIDTENCGCNECVWGIKNMEGSRATYCECFYGRLHVLGQPPPWYINLSTTILNTLRGWFKN